MYILTSRSCIGIPYKGSQVSLDENKKLNAVLETIQLAQVMINQCFHVFVFNQLMRPA